MRYLVAKVTLRGWKWRRPSSCSGVLMVADDEDDQVLGGAIFTWS